MLLLRLFSFATCIYFVVGFMQELTFYTEVNSGGNAFRFRTKEPDLTHYSELLRDVKSYCSIGWWLGFSSTNYTSSVTFNTGVRNGVLCGNTTLSPIMSLRYSGPLDTSTPSISIYSGVTGNNVGGVERTYTGLAATYFGFVPTGAVITGMSSWTGFENYQY
ncbi:uncharacterized protein LOC110862938 [Folsomia candida]|uniref:uncharacterized protein LOC110862938 n=1 Tax=Folsomia candida TaxID=158441 RepID=UPI000B906F72|nr:uncharacterized protein LOC110862938 [Folsomia candida]